MSPLQTISSISHRVVITPFPIFWRTSSPKYTERSLLPTFTCTLPHQSDTALDIIVRPHGWHLALERLERKLERRAWVPDLELLQHARVQDA